MGSSSLNKELLVNGSLYQVRYFYVLDIQVISLVEGSLDVIINGESKKKLIKGDMLGELALMYNQPRSASIRCIGECFFWCIDRENFMSGVRQIIMEQSNEVRPTINEIPVFDYLTNAEKDELATALI